MRTSDHLAAYENSEIFRGAKSLKSVSALIGAHLLGVNNGEVAHTSHNYLVSSFRRIGGVYTSDGPRFRASVVTPDNYRVDWTPEGFSVTAP